MAIVLGIVPASDQEFKTYQMGLIALSRTIDGI